MDISSIDLDALLATDEPPKEKLPITYEEYVAIHGEPIECITESAPTFIDIQPEEADEPQIYIDMAKESISTNKRGDPCFIDGKFAKAYLCKNNLVHSNGAFYTPDGMKKVGSIRNEVSEDIYDFFPTNIAQSTTRVVNALKDLSYRDDFNFSDFMIIPFTNGDMEVKEKGQWVFHYEGKRPVPYRLPVEFIPLTARKGTPNFDKWLHDLFTDDDIVVLQEYIGYCLLPTTRCQKALLLIGEGGVGKSIIGSILKALFGSSVTAPDNTVAFLADKFKTAELENQLVFYEDDLSDALLDDAGKFKKLITSPMAITADRKNEQPFKFVPYCRFIMCGNHMLQATNDKSDGFYRRLLPISTKPKDPNRQDIAYFEEKVAAEVEGISQWAILGLKRLIDQNWQFTISNRTNEYLSNYRELTDHIPSFVSDCVVPDKNGSITHDELNRAYRAWCARNATKAVAEKTLKEWFFNNGEKIGLVKVSSNNIVRDGKRYRGYKGGCVREEWLKSNSILLT